MPDPAGAAELPRPPRADRLRLALQLLGSAAVLAALWWTADPAAVLAALGRAEPAWVLAACLAELAGLRLRAWRVARAAEVGGPEATRVLLAANLLAVISVARAGDLVAAAWLARATGIGLVRAVAGFGAIGAADVFVHALWLLVALGLASTLVDAGVADARVRENGIALVAAGLLAVAAAWALARRVVGQLRPGPVREGAGHALRQLGPVALLGGVAQLACVYLVFRFNIAAVAPDLARPWLTAALAQALGAVGAFLMPAAMGAGPAAAVAVVLPALGAAPAEGVALGALLWFTATFPSLGLGLWALWRGRSGRA